MVAVFKVETGWGFGVKVVLRRGENTGRGFGGESVTGRIVCSGAVESVVHGM